MDGALAQVERGALGGERPAKAIRAAERKMGKFIDELPVWPFDASTLRKFLFAYIVPLLSSGGLSAAKMFFELAKHTVAK